MVCVCILDMDIGRCTKEWTCLLLREHLYMQQEMVLLWLHIEDAVLENLRDLFPAGVRPGMGSRNVCLSGCTVADPSVPEGTRLSELLILMPEGSGDRERWNAIPCSKFSYFEYRT